MSGDAPDYAGLRARLEAFFGPAARVALGPLQTDGAGLLPAEEELVARAVLKRRAEFASGRVAARRSLGELGYPEAPLLRGPLREPLWPAGAVGTITHTAGLCAVAVAHERELRSLGLDAEQGEPLKPDLWRMVCTPRELAWLDTLPEAERGRQAKAVFSAKECFYKLQFTFTQSFLGFQEVEMRLEGERWSIRVENAEVAGRLPANPLEGEILAREPWVITAAKVEAGS